MRSHARTYVLIALLLGTAALRADDSLAHARRAQVLLGPDVWSQVIRIENHAHPSRYPHTLHALIFELEGILWFYTDTDGTQSFSLHRSRLAEEKADFRPLLTDIEPGFVRWQAVPGGPGEELGELPNGCFIESVAALRARLTRGEEALNPELLLFYVDTPDGLAGHTVLTYAAHGHQEVVDSELPGAPLRFSASLGSDAVALAHAVSHERVAKARLLPFTLPGSDSPFLALSYVEDSETPGSPARPRRIATVR